MSNSHLRGKSLLRQSVANMKQVEYVHNHPASYGWEYTGEQPDYGLPVYEKDGVKLMRHPAGDCWLVQWMDRCYLSEVDHVRDINVSVLKDEIEYDIIKEG